MSTTSEGREAETFVAGYLEKRGYKLLDKNWRTRFCEIDLVMKKRDTVYFVEVKYRRTSMYGDGLEYITPKKLKQMEFAVELWCAHHNWSGNMAMLAVSVDGKNEITITAVE